MSLEQQRRLFDACLDAASEQEREQLLRACPDPELREQVRSLLRAHAAAPDSIYPQFSAPDFPRMASPHQIGPYRILERLGEGAMGDVFLAEQSAPVRRRVALKIIKFGLASRDVIARFELERQTLALLTHQNIARIFEAGATEDGRPYFAMEYVPGVPITRYCDERRLDCEARLALFRQVCAGVQHAHLRGVIHRDLKPSNILVAEIDGAPVPKIIDFGIAKATTTTAGSGEVYTRFGNLLGTPEYMSPEQAQLSPLEIDVRTDVYSLGVVLYELLTGARPYCITSDSINPALVLQEIVTREARRPSEVAAEYTPETAARAAQRGLTPATLAACLRGDLDWIVLKAIEKQRQHRYDSPMALAEDLQRHADHEPVSAGPPSTSYRLGKFIRRHRLAVSALSVIFLAAILFGSGMGWFAHQAAAERDRANEQAEVARRVTAFTAGLFELANPLSSGSSDVSARQLLDAGVRRLQLQGATQRPQVRAALLESAGNAYRGLGSYDEAERLLKEALATRIEDTTQTRATRARILLGLALVNREQGDFDEAMRLAREAIRGLEQAPHTEPDALSRARLELAEILRRRSELQEAAMLARLGLTGSISPTARARALTTLGRIRTAQGKLSQAQQLLQQAYELHLQLEGPLAEMTLEAKNGLANAFATAGQAQRAEPLLRGLVEDARKVYGERHDQYGIALSNLAMTIADIAGKQDEAAQLLTQAAAVLRQAKGPSSVELGAIYNNLGALYLSQRRWHKADQVYQQAIAIRSSSLGPQHPETAASMSGWAVALSHLQRFQQAEAQLLESIAIFTAALGPDHWRTANAHLSLGFTLATSGRRADAEQQVERGYQTLVNTLGKDHWRAERARQLIKKFGLEVPAAS